MSLDPWQDEGVFSALDVSFARAMRRLAGEASAEVELAAALASRAVGRGHVCIDLARLAGRHLTDDDGHPVEPPLPSLAGWLAAVESSRLVGGAEQITPLVLEGTRLYLRRYYTYETRLAASLLARADRSLEVDRTRLQAGLQRLFPQAEVGDKQRRAAALAVLRGLSVISGGPGTGKTTTVVKLLALVQEQAVARGAPARILLVAPTGKAAQRLGESVAASLGRLDIHEEIRAHIPTEASTIHRTLGFSPRHPTRFLHDATHPLPADVVVADEASMIDLALMTKLCEAVPRDARLVLLGDKDQLASVEAGAVLGDVYPPRPVQPTRAMGAALTEVLGEAIEGDPESPALADAVIHLDRSYRYDARSGIGALAQAIKAGDGDQAIAVLRGDATMPYGEVALSPADPASPLAGPLGRVVLDGFRAVQASGLSPEERLTALSTFRVLCAHRRGPLGVEDLNRAIAQRLRHAGLLAPDGDAFDGRPIMVTRNDYAAGLFNGDIGLIVREGRGLIAVFPNGSEARRVALGRLPPHETVFAMTVHKSQGSEHDRVAVVLPPRASPILTRELVYTGITRARRRVDVFADEAIVRAAIRQRVARWSGLGARLWD